MAFLVAAAFLLAGCQGASPGFLERSQQDCARGDKDACHMLSALDPAVPRRALTGRTQVQKNVQAILQGMDQARASETFGLREETPSAPPATQAPAGGDASSPAAPDEP
jgi:hypothetical protein